MRDVHVLSTGTVYETVIVDNVPDSTEGGVQLVLYRDSTCLEPVAWTTETSIVPAGHRRMRNLGRLRLDAEEALAWHAALVDANSLPADGRVRGWLVVHDRGDVSGDGPRTLAACPVPVVLRDFSPVARQPGETWDAALRALVDAAVAGKADQSALDSAVASLAAADESLADRLDAVEETLPEKADLDSSGTVPVSQLPVRDIVSEALEAFGTERWPWVDWPGGPLPSAEAVLSVPYLPASAWPIALATGPDDEELVAVDGPDQLDVERTPGGGWAFLSGGRRIGCWDSAGRWESLGYWGYVDFGGSSEPPSLRRDLVVPLRPWTVTAPTRAALDWFFLDSGWDGCLVFEPTTSDGAPDGAAFAAAAVVDLPRGAAPCRVKWTGPSHWSPASRSRGSWTTRVSAPETDLVAPGARVVWRVTAARRQTGAGDPRPSAVERVPPAAVEASPLHLPPLGDEYAAVSETVSTPVVSVDGRVGAVRLDDYAKLVMDTAAGWASDPGFVPAAGQIVVYSDGGVRPDGSVYPRIKIGDGSAYALDLDFVGDDLADRIRANAQALSDHEADMVRHITAAERAYWNDKVTTSSVVADGTLVVTKDNLLP